jgi:hypothetical protein
MLYAYIIYIMRASLFAQLILLDLSTLIISDGGKNDEISHYNIFSMLLLLYYNYYLLEGPESCAK